ncbi:methenyltetrahydrofolate cyclohydrolase [bacterium]|nr:MAG: methenyltetrahydrofolate cyclohydrolase [bacterium]
MILNKSLETFFDELASNSATPGGGSIAALAGASSAGLISMVCNLSIGKKNCEQHQEEIKSILEKSEELRKHQQELIEQDVEAFNDFMSALRMPKNNEEEKLLRKEALNHALQKATFVPVRIMEHSAELLLLSLKLAPICNKNVISDVGIAAVMAESAINSAWFNVAINLNSCKDEEFADRIWEKTEQIMDKIEGITEQTIEIIQDELYSND